MPFPRAPPTSGSLPTPNTMTTITRTMISSVGPTGIAFLPRVGVFDGREAWTYVATRYTHDSERIFSPALVVNVVVGKSPARILLLWHPVRVGQDLRDGGGLRQIPAPGGLEGEVGRPSRCQPVGADKGVVGPDHVVVIVQEPGVHHVEDHGAVGLVGYGSGELEAHGQGAVLCRALGRLQH